MEGYYSEDNETNSKFNVDSLYGTETPLLPPLEQPIGKFAMLKYGKNKELLFNINCQVSIQLGWTENSYKPE